MSDKPATYNLNSFTGKLGKFYVDWQDQLNQDHQLAAKMILTKRKMDSRLRGNDISSSSLPSKMAKHPALPEPTKQSHI